MPFTNEDRRARRTKAKLREALARLLQEKALAHITVREVAQLADVNRSTFYLHYTDIYDLYQKMEDGVVEEITAIISAGPRAPGNVSFLPMVRGVFDYVAHNVLICTALLRTDDAAFISRLVSLNRPRDEQQWQALMGNCSLPRDYCYAFITSGCVGLVRAWFDGGMRESATFIADMADRLLAAAQKL